MVGTWFPSVHELAQHEHQAMSFSRHRLKNIIFMRFSGESPAEARDVGITRR